MPGIPQWQKNVQVQANPSKRVRSLLLNFSDAIPSGETMIRSLTSPDGYVSKIINMYLIYPAIDGATSGSTRILVSPAGGSFGLIRATGDYDKALTFEYYQWFNAKENSPTDISPVLSYAYFDATNYITFIYQNLTDENDAGQQKTLQLLLLEEKIQ